MATIVKTPSGTWKALIRKTGWPPAGKTFRTKRDAEDWSRRTEDEMVRGVYIQRAPAERMTVAAALKRYLKEVTPTKRPSSKLASTRKLKPSSIILVSIPLPHSPPTSLLTSEICGLQVMRMSRGYVSREATTRYGLN